MPLDRFQLVRNFIDQDTTVGLRDQFLTDLPKIGYSGDRSCPQSPSAYNYRPFVRLMCVKQTVVEDVFGGPLLPTYTYARQYTNGATLAVHTDRPACEVSVTLNLSSDVSWPIFMDGTPVEMNPGDAAVYLGIEVPHWRNAFPGTECVQVFMHYVDLNGPHSNLYFERLTG